MTEDMADCDDAPGEFLVEADLTNAEAVSAVCWLVKGAGHPKTFAAAECGTRCHAWTREQA